MVDETSNFMSMYCTVHERKSGAICVCFLHAHVNFSISCSHWCMFHLYVDLLPFGSEGSRVETRSRDFTEVLKKKERLHRSLEEEGETSKKS